MVGGGQDELVFDGAILIADHTGELLARGPSFAEGLMVTDLDADAVSGYRLQNPRTPQGGLGRLREDRPGRTGGGLPDRDIAR